MDQTSSEASTDLARYLAHGAIRRARGGRARVDSALALAQEHLLAGRMATQQGMEIAAIGCVVGACRKAMIGLAAACGYEVVPRATVSDGVLDGALCAVGAAQHPYLVPLVQRFPAAVAYMEAAGITEQPNRERTEEVIDLAEALIDALHSGYQRVGGRS